MQQPSVRDLLADGPRISFEFMPPRDAAAAESLWRAITELEAYAPAFVSVTYGAGGSTRDTTVAMTARIAAETSLRPMGHLTCVGHTKDELVSIISSYREAGVRDVLALRGDPPEGPRAAWPTTSGGLNYAVELVELLTSLGGFSVGVAAFPEGHPAADSLEVCARVLADKARAGADFAITQLFFDPDDYFRLVDRVAAHGVSLPIVPGLMPVTNLAQVGRMAELSGATVPASVRDRLLAAPDRVREVGVEIAVEMGQKLLAGGAPGLHLFTLNRSSATRDVVDHLRALAGPLQ